MEIVNLWFEDFKMVCARKQFIRKYTSLQLKWVTLLFPGFFWDERDSMWSWKRRIQRIQIKNTKHRTTFYSAHGETKSHVWCAIMRTVRTINSKLFRQHKFQIDTSFLCAFMISASSIWYEVALMGHVKIEAWLYISQLSRFAISKLSFWSFFARKSSVKCLQTRNFRNFGTENVNIKICRVAGRYMHVDSMQMTLFCL